jgi:hypothetical protein
MTPPQRGKANFNVAEAGMELCCLLQLYGRRVFNCGEIGHPSFVRATPQAASFVRKILEETVRSKKGSLAYAETINAL